MSYNISDSSFDPQDYACLKYIDGVGNNFHYIPSLPAAIIFIALFSLSGIAHLVQSVYTRSWWYLVFTVGCLSMYFVLLHLNMEPFY